MNEQTIFTDTELHQLVNPKAMTETQLLLVRSIAIHLPLKKRAAFFKNLFKQSPPSPSNETFIKTLSETMENL